MWPDTEIWGQRFRQGNGFCPLFRVQVDLRHSIRYLASLDADKAAKNLRGGVSYVFLGLCLAVWFHVAKAAPLLTYGREILRL